MSKFDEEIDYVEEKRANIFSNFITLFLVAIILFMVVVIGYKLLFINIQVSGNSMLPTLHNGELYVVNKLDTPSRGDLTIINIEERMKGDNKYWIIKRIIGVEGDTVKIENGKVYLKKPNETEFSILEEEYIQGKTEIINNKEKNEWTIGFNEFFFLGDNRENSTDSRVYGVRKLDDVVGVVTDWSKEKSGFWYSFNKVVNFPSKIFSSWNSKTSDGIGD